jgi:hypothetical protein
MRPQATRGFHKQPAAIALSAQVLLSLPVFAQNPFPEGAGREAVLAVCSQCHPLTRITESELGASAWELLLYDMIARGAPIHAEDLGQVHRYLIEHFATDARSTGSQPPTMSETIAKE